MIVTILCFGCCCEGRKYVVVFQGVSHEPTAPRGRKFLRVLCRVTIRVGERGPARYF